MKIIFINTILAIPFLVLIVWLDIPRLIDPGFTSTQIMISALGLTGIYMMFFIAIPFFFLPKKVLNF